MLTEMKKMLFQSIDILYSLCQSESAFNLLIPQRYKYFIFFPWARFTHYRVFHFSLVQENSRTHYRILDCIFLLGLKYID